VPEPGETLVCTLSLPAGNTSRSLDDLCQSVQSIGLWTYDVCSGMDQGESWHRLVIPSGFDVRRAV
jgi:hypothetical protein